MTNEEAVRLAKLAQSGDTTATERLVDGYRAAVHKVANDFMISGIDPEDLVREATLGFLEFVKVFDPQRGVKFCTGAFNWMRYYLMNATRTAQSNISLSPRVVTQATAIQHAMEDVYKSSGRFPTEEEVQVITGLAASVVRKSVVPSADLSLDDPLFDDDAYDSMPDERRETPDEIHELVTDIVESVKDDLTDRELAVLRCYFSSPDGHGRTQQEIAKELGISRQAISEPWYNALRKIRVYLLSNTRDANALLD